MRRVSRILALIGLLASLTAAPLASQDRDPADLAIRQITTHMGEMEMAVEAGDLNINDSLVFEPFQARADLFFRRDVVYLMRHGPTDWSKRDENNVAPTDCANQRIMTDQGRADMRNLGRLLGSNFVIPAKIVVSEWCRNQQTLDSMLQGFADISPDLADDIPVETDGDVNLLLSLQGAPNTVSLEDRISNWEGDPERSGPLLIISHYTNIEELTQFRVFEGEILVLDPKRDNRVLGYLRLRSANPDVGHFADALDSDFRGEENALDMVERYYASLNNREFDVVEGLLSEDWFMHGVLRSGNRNAATYFNDLEAYVEGMPDAQFYIQSLHHSDNVVTVIGFVGGTHTGELFGVPPTGRQVVFSAIAVHRIRGSEIVESWQTADRFSLMEQIQAPEIE